MQEINIQEYLFKRIKEKLAPDVSLTDVISEKLFISRDSAYRRIRGETLLVLDEAKTLCEAFQISLDQVLTAKANSISFTPVEVASSERSFEKYLNDILYNLKMLLAADEKEIIYLTKDMPIFYDFAFRPLFAFHYFFWMKSILQHPDFAFQQFSIDLLTPELEQIGKEIMETYSLIPSTEIWNTECVNSIIAQIEYYREAGYFKSDSDARKLYEALAATIDHIRTQAEFGTKFLPGGQPALKKNNFKFFYNRLVLGDNTILVSANGRKTAYLNYEVLNYMIIDNESFCNDIHLKLQNLMKRATLLSEVSDKQRNIFFNILLKKFPGKFSTVNVS